jgi:hypothetical protein
MRHELCDERCHIVGLSLEACEDVGDGATVPRNETAD